MRVEVEINAGWYAVGPYIQAHPKLAMELRERLSGSDIARERIVDAGIDTSEINEDGYAYTGVTVAVPLWELNVTPFRDEMSQAIKDYLGLRGGGGRVYEVRTLISEAELELVELSADGVRAVYSLEVAG